jgi:hypothetical protein
MRGGAQAHLLEGGDGYCYVTKFRQNPQHHRILINEFIATRLLEYLQVATPPSELIDIDAELLRREPSLGIQLAGGPVPIEPGLHFGSRFPGHPDRDAVYDYLPDPLLRSVYNQSHFLGVLAFDKWTANTDSRQAIFVRQRVREWVAEAPAGRKSFIALMIDHGFAFDGPYWVFQDVPAQGLYFRPLVYCDVRSMADFEPWLERIATVPSTLLDRIGREVPRSWLDAADQPALDTLLDELYARRTRVAGLIAASIAVRPSMFPHWGLGAARATV